jgi:hypothetical protein
MDLFCNESMELKKEVIEWLRENIGNEAKNKYDLMARKSSGHWCFELFGNPDFVFYFKVVDHAILFKLTWLGIS